MAQIQQVDEEKYYFLNQKPLAFTQPVTLT